MAVKSNTQKRVPKNPIKFQLTLNEEQKETKRLILNNAITVIKGKAGSGKINKRQSGFARCNQRK